MIRLGVNLSLFRGTKVGSPVAFDSYVIQVAVQVQVQLELTKTDWQAGAGPRQGRF